MHPETRKDLKIVLEALVQFAGPEADTLRRRRAWELIEMISGELDRGAD